jgi:cytochrome c oxidase subunit IV
MSHGVASERHEGMTVKPYLVIFLALAVFTAVSFLVNSAEKPDGVFGRAVIETGTGFAIILAVAVLKALLVALFFMHLVMDWRRVYFIIVPALVLATALVLALWPDMVLAWQSTS